MTTGERIKLARKAAGLTQTELAEKIGVKFSAIHKYESGMVVNLKRETIAALASALDVSPAWLMCMDDEQKQSRPEDLINGDPLLTRIVEQARDNPRIRALFSLTADATPEDVEAAIKIIEALKERG